MPKDNTLLAVYDLSVGPDTYNFAPFILLAQAEQAYQGCENLHIALIPGDRPGFDLWEAEHKGWRLRQIVMPLLSAFAPEARVSIFSKREQARELIEQTPANQLCPVNYSLEKPVASFSLKAVAQALESGRCIKSYPLSKQADSYIKAWKERFVGERKLITITLRQAHYWPERNSDIEAWVKFSKALDPQRYYPVFVCDTDQALSPDPRLLDCQLMAVASFNVEMRHALYENSALNMMVNGGPAILCNYSQQASYLYFKVLSPGVVCTNLSYFQKEGFLPGRQWFGAKKNQRLIWEEDRFSIIYKAFDEMDKRLDGEALTLLEDLCMLSSKALSLGDVEAAWDWSALAVSFYDQAPEAWLLRVRVLLQTGRFLEGCYNLVYGFQVCAGLGSLWEGAVEKQLGTAQEQCFVQATLFKEAYPNWKEALLSKVKRFEREQMQVLNKLLSGKKVLVFGTGQGAEQACALFEGLWDVVAFLDNDVAKQGALFQGVPVLAIQALERMEWDFIVIASSFAEAINTQLLSEGVDLSSVITLGSSILEPQSIIV
tara:strand:- start:28606 stop:30240 length:1635 start_codon:yes stop_codon:yes gene_type:complete